MHDRAAIEAAIRRGMAYIQSVQAADGGFDSFICAKGTVSKPILARRTTAIPAAIIAALSTCNREDSAPILSRAAAWLLGHKTGAWTMPFFVQTTNQSGGIAAPDLLSTFSALTALYSYNPTLITPQVLGLSAKLLIHSESEVGGPYYNHPVTGASAHLPKLDIAANAVIARFVASVAEPLPKLGTYLDIAIAERSFASPSFTSQWSVIYHIAHAYHGTRKRALATYVIERYARGRIDNPLDSALAISTIIQLGEKAPDDAIAQLLKTQATDGSWPATGYCARPELDTNHYGAAALTTAYATEALARYQQTLAPALPAPNLTTLSTDKGAAVYDKVLAHAKRQLDTLDMPLRGHCLQAVGHLRQADKNREVVLMGFFTAESIAKPTAFDDKLYIQLGLANLYNWLAYTIYDDFLDGEGDPQLLSVAHVAMRYSIRQFNEALPEHTGFQSVVAELFDAIDCANAWEVSACRFPVASGLITIGSLPRYGRRTRLAERSCSHSLPAIGMLVAVGLMPSDPKVIACRTAFKHYLIARQLNDDMHDWEEDALRGHISYVVAEILHELRIPPGTVVPLADLIPRMKQQFWNHTLSSICKDINDHTSQGRRAIMRSKLLNKFSFLGNLLDNLDGVAAHSIAERDKANDFLEAYRAAG